MKKLLLMRHAKSSWNHEGVEDHDRPLNERGKKSAPLMADWLDKNEFVPDLIVSSTANRAFSTAKLVNEHLERPVELISDRRIYHASTEEMVEVVNSVDSEIETLMLVGHNPGMQAMVYQLTDQWEEMVTAAIGVVELEIENWFDLRPKSNGSLIQFIRPKELPGWTD